MFDQTDELSVKTLRMLAAQMTNKAHSGHPGISLGAAPMLYVLWTRHLNVNPDKPRWINRDRFVLSAGHATPLYFPLLYLSGFALTMADLQAFRTTDSITTGHPEVVGSVPGIEATTGPLGQGIGMSAGMAAAETHLAAQFNLADVTVMDHYTYALVSDGELMEGISHEAADFAGKQALSKLILLYDSNNIDIDGAISRETITDAQTRFRAYGWDTLMVADGNDLEAIDAAITFAKTTDKPTLIEVNTTIGFGSPDAGQKQAHGTPVSDEGLQILAANLDWDYPAWTVPAAVATRFITHVYDRGIAAYDQWVSDYEAFADKAPAKFEALNMSFNHELADVTDILPTYTVGSDQSILAVNGDVIDAISKRIPDLWGGSADLAGSTYARVSDSGLFEADNRAARNLAFGVREFAMSTIMSGIALHGGSHVFGSTFLAFADYAKNSIRLAALQQLPLIYLLSHDSIGAGQDGATHQAIEQLMQFRNVPNLTVIRPADATEAVAAWQIALESSSTPTIISEPRQVVPTLANTTTTGVRRGAYTLSPAANDKPEGIIIGTGSEVQVALAAAEQLRAAGHNVAVVSMPSFELFVAQDTAYQASVLPPNTRRRIAVEAGSTLGWERYVGLDGAIVGIDQFGTSGTDAELMIKYGITAENVVAQYLKLS
ncbi:transketolase [Periweissella cryptocerci]|uniref:Transketolase n=1 Tax=Periweissella cryptocerci TaxID=2506420 RepID=A0A4P6YRF2_9LACO|nr:transketolase [Periweissella cryptocerci]QBO35191.1 transketolase [Periweissella cryptocerci]